MPLYAEGKQVVVAAESSAALHMGGSGFLVTILGLLVSIGFQSVGLNCTFLGPEGIWPSPDGCGVVLMAIDLSRVVAFAFAGDRCGLIVVFVR